MNHKAFVIIIVILILVFVGIFGAWLWIQKGGNLGSRVATNSQTGSSTTATPEPEPLFPQGQTQPITTAVAPNPDLDAGSVANQVIDQFAPNQTNSPLTRLWNKPVAGAFRLENASSSQIIFVDRATGHVYEVKEGSPVRISNTTMPKIYEALAAGTSGEGLRLIYRTLSNNYINNTAIILNANSSVEGQIGEATKTTVPQFNAIAPAPNQKQIAYLAPQSGKTSVFTWDWKAQPTLISTLPVNELSLAWPTTNTLAVLTKPSGRSNGFLFFIDLKTKALTRVLGNIFGLSTLVDPGQQFVLYSSTNNLGQNVATNLYNLKTKTSESLPVKTLAEKCTWGTDSDTLYCAVPEEFSTQTQPDSWYSGEFSSSDSLWEIKINNKEAKMLVNPKLKGQEIDAINLFINREATKLYLTNKKDLTLWSLDLQSSF